MPNSAVNITMPSMTAEIKASVTSQQILQVVKDTNDLPERVKETVDNVLNNYSDESFKSLAEFLEIGFSPEVIEILETCTELVQLFL